MNRKELEAWLNTRSREDAILIGQRAAMRVFPLWGSQMGENWARKRNFTSNLMFREYLLYSLQSKGTLPATKIALANAAKATLRARENFPGKLLSSSPSGNGAATAAYYALLAVVELNETIKKTVNRSEAIGNVAAASAVQAVAWAHDASFSRGGRANDTTSRAAKRFWETVERDLAFLREGKSLLNVPLWHGDPPVNILHAEAKTLQNLTRETGDPNSFWHRWWRGAVSGNWLDWALQREVALIPDDIWQQGPKVVAAAIAEIEARHPLTLTDNAEAIAPDPETGRLVLVPSSALPSDLGQYARRKMLKAADLVDDPACLQLYGGLASDLAMLRAAVADAANMPVELYDACASATRRLAIRAANGECPPPDKDAVLSDYLTRLREVAADILSHDPATQSVLDRRHAITGNAALIDAVQAVQLATADMVPVTAGHLAQALPKDAALATDPNAAPEDRKAAAFRWAGRVLRIGRWVGGAMAGTGGALVLSKEVLEALPILQASPYFQQAMAAILKWLNLG